MIHNAVENTALIKALEDNVNDASKWIALAESQSTSTGRIQILNRAVETVPSNQELWERLVDAKIQSSGENSFEVLSDALGLFPDNVSLWQRMFSLFPSVETYTTALRHLDNDLVWPKYLQYLHENTGISPVQRLAGYQHYYEYTHADEDVLQDLALRLVSWGQVDDAVNLILSHSCSTWRIWEPLVFSEAANVSLLESAIHIFPQKDSILVPMLAQKLVATGESNKARMILLKAISSSSSVAAFCELFRVICEYYESTLTSTVKQQGAGATEVARVLAEFGNLIRKRPMYLSDVAIREFPNSVALWKSRAKLWKHRPHIAADVLETALKTIDPALAYQGELSELWVEYTHLLVINGSDVSLARSMLVKALDTYFAKASEKARVYVALAKLELDDAKDPEAAIRVLEKAIKSPALAPNCELWTVYISSLIETKSNTVLEAFSSCCIQQMVSMRIVAMVAKSYPDASDNQVIVFDKGVQLFPFPLVLPIWKQYLMAVQESYDINELRALYERALISAASHRRATEELKLLYSRAERSHKNGSRMFAKRVLTTSLKDSKNLDLWSEFIELHDDVEEKRSLYEQAVNKLDDREASILALRMAKFEASVGEIERARAIYYYIVRLSEGLEEESALLREQWNTFEHFHGNDITRKEMENRTQPSMSIHFVQSTDMEL